MSRIFARAAGVALVVAAPASAQVPSASTAALGMGDNFTAAARALNAVAWNPAGLGLRGGAAASMTLLTARGSNGIDPITLSDLASFAGTVVPAAVKEDWLARIEASGGETGTGAVEATWAAFHAGRLAFQLSSASRVLGDVSPGLARLIMFGNTDQNGDPRSLDLGGSSFRLHAYSTAAASWGHPLDLAGGGRLALGVTASYTWGHVLAFGERSDGSAIADPLSLDLVFPVIQTRLDPDSLRLNSGRGFNLDAGAALQTGSWTFGAVVRNILSGFAWNAEDLRYRPLSFTFREGESSTRTEALPITAAPAALRTLADELRFRPAIALGAMTAPSDRLAVTADARLAGDDGLLTGPTRHLGVGLQYRLLSWLPVRAGAAAIAMGKGDPGFQLGFGLGLDLAGVNVAGSFARRATDRLGAETTFMLTILSAGLR